MDIKRRINPYEAPGVPLKGIQDWIQGARGATNGYFGLFWLPLAPLGPCKALHYSQSLFKRQSREGRPHRNIFPERVLGAVLGSFWAVLGGLGAVLRTWEGHLGQSWAVLGPSWGRLGRSWAVLGRPGPVLDRLGPSWGRIEPNVGQIRGQFWAHIGLDLDALLGSFLGPGLSRFWDWF